MYGPDFNYVSQWRLYFGTSDPHTDTLFHKSQVSEKQTELAVELISVFTQQLPKTETSPEGHQTDCSSEELLIGRPIGVGSHSMKEQLQHLSRDGPPLLLARGGHRVPDKIVCTSEKLLVQIRTLTRTGNSIRKFIEPDGGEVVENSCFLNTPLQKEQNIKQLLLFSHWYRELVPKLTLSSLDVTDGCSIVLLSGPRD